MTLIKKTGALIAILGLAVSLSWAGAGTAHAQTSTLFTTDLTIGSTGVQVNALQTFLISKGYSIPAGATGYFGAQTQAATAAYQRANGIVPPAGYFGPITRAHVNVAQATNPPSQDNEDEGNSSGLRGGEASLERFRMNDGDDSEVEENRSAEVAEIEFRVEDGDVRVNRIDLTFEPGAGNDEDEPWEAFETIRLLVDGDEIAEEDVSDEDDWLRDDEPYVFRFTGINEIFREGDTARIVVEIEAQNGVLDSGSTDTWTLSVEDDGIRAIDSERLQQYVGNDSDTVTFDLEEAGAGEELSVRSSSENPNASLLKVEDDRRSDWYTIFVFDIEAEENDIELNDFAIDFETGTADVEDVIDDAILVIDGDEFDDFDWNGSGTFASTTFDIDGDFTLDDGDRVEVEVMVRFKAANGANYNPGETIRASVDGANVEGEGADDVTADGSVVGKTHALSLSAAEISNVRWTASESANGGTGVIDFFFTITAEDEDFDVLSAEIMDTITGSDFLGATTTPVTASDQGSLSRVSGDQVDTIAGGFQVDEGETTRFRVRYNANSAGTYEVNIESVAGIEIDDEDQLSPTIVLE